MNSGGIRGQNYVGYKQLGAWVICEPWFTGSQTLGEPWVLGEP